MKTFKQYNQSISMIIFFLILIVCAHTLACADKITINKVNILAGKNSTVVSFSLSEPRKPGSVIQLTAPERLLIELDGKKIFYDKKQLSVNKGLIAGIRFELKPSSLRSKEVEYVVLEMKEMFTFAQSYKKNKWIFTITSRDVIDFNSQPIKSIKEPLDLKQAIDVARSNYVPAQISLEKIKLAKLRRFEALRAVFPALLAKYEQTRGEAKQEQSREILYGFKERLISFQFSQPLYQGGKLKATYDQACVNLKIAELQYNKIIHELEFEVVKAYMNVVKFQVNAQLFKNVYDEIQDDFKIAENLYKQKLSTKVEYLNVQSKLKQMHYQLASIRKDLELAKAQLLQVLNIDNVELKEIVPYTEYSELNLSLDKLLHQMRLNQPNLRLAEYELKLSRLGKIIGRSGKNFKVELTGSIGRSASNYNTELKEWKNDYSGGVKVSKAYGGNTLSTSYLYDDTAEKLGQSSRTLSETGSAQIAILDNIKSISEAKESDIALRETSYKLIESKRHAVIEVKTSFFNFEKAVIQLQGIQEEVQLNQEELSVTKQKKDLNMAKLSEYVESKVKLANSRSSLNETFSFYHISLAGINKAIGMPRYYKSEKQ